MAKETSINIKIKKSQRLADYFTMEGTEATATLTYVREGSGEEDNVRIKMDEKDMRDLKAVVDAYLENVDKFKQTF